MQARVSKSVGLVLALFFVASLPVVLAAQDTSSIKAQTPAYSLYASRGTYYARNNSTGSIISSGSDAGAVIRSLMTSAASTCGTIYVYPGTYNINSLALDPNVSSTYYGIGFPASAATNQYCNWTVWGDGMPAVVDQFGTPVQTSGVIFNITPRALSSVPSSADVKGVWAMRPLRGGGVYFGPGASVTIRNIDVRYPTNQSSGIPVASIAAVDMRNALNFSCYYSMADYNVAQASLQYPASNTWGIVTPNSSHEETRLDHCYAIGSYYNIDGRTEHLTIEDSGGLDGAYCMRYGAAGGKIYHASVWTDLLCGENTYGVALGPELQQGSLLNASIDFEECLGTCTAGFPARSLMSEANPGYSFGNISYSVVLQNVGVIPVPFVFDGRGSGRGQYFTLTHSNSLWPSSVLPDYDTFTGTSGTTLASHTTNSGNTWSMISTGTTVGTTMVLNGNNSASPSGTGFTTYINSLIPSSANYSVTAIEQTNGSGGSSISLLARSNAGATTMYSIFCDTGQPGCEIAYNSTALATYRSFVPGANTVHRYSIVVYGSTITGCIDGVAQMTATNTSITSAGQAALQMGGGTNLSAILGWYVLPATSSACPL